MHTVSSIKYVLWNKKKKAIFIGYSEKHYRQRSWISKLLISLPNSMFDTEESANRYLQDIKRIKTKLRKIKALSSELQVNFDDIVIKKIRTTIQVF